MPPAWHRAPPAGPAPPRLPGCTGKMGWASRQEARRVADRRGHRYIYPCQHCRLWHTSNAGKFKPAKGSTP